jgi:hypothetical protein
LRLYTNLNHIFVASIYKYSLTTQRWSGFLIINKKTTLRRLPWWITCIFYLLYNLITFTIVHRNGVKIPHADPDNEATETPSHLNIAENTITHTAKSLHQAEIDNYIDDQLMITSVQTTQQSNSNINIFPILQSDITHFKFKPHRLESKVTSVGFENTNPTLIFPTLRDSTDNTHTSTPPCDEFPNPHFTLLSLNFVPHFTQRN